METLKYRRKAKFIAIIDLLLALTFISFGLPLVFPVIAVHMTWKSEEVPPPKRCKFFKSEDCLDDPSDHNLAIITAWCFFVVSSVILAIQVYVGLMLVNATKPEREASSAAWLSRVWIICTAVSTVFLGLGCLLPYSPLYLLKTPLVLQFGRSYFVDLVALVWLCFLFRCVGIYIVGLFVKELNGVVSKSIPLSQDQIENCQITRV